MPRSRYPETLGKYWYGPIDPTRPGENVQGSTCVVKAGINSETGEHVCCKIPHVDANLELEGFYLQAALEHANIVGLKDIVFEKVAGRPHKQLCPIMELESGGELFQEERQKKPDRAQT